MPNFSRRNFLFGNIKTLVDRVQNVSLPNPLLRPPGAIAEHLFLQKCKNCRECVDACQAGVIRIIDAPLHPAHNTAYLDISSGGCHFCDDFPCIKACQKGALANEDLTIGHASVGSKCITNHHQYCELCVRSCPNNISAFIVEDRGKVRIDPEKCVGCGLCVSSCFLSPSAISIRPPIKTS